MCKCIHLLIKPHSFIKVVLTKWTVISWNQPQKNKQCSLLSQWNYFNPIFTGSFVPKNQVFTKKGQWLFFTNYLTACTDCQGCNTSICTPSRNRLVSSVHFNQFNAQNLRNVNGKCVENARKTLKMHIFRQNCKPTHIGWEICTSKGILPLSFHLQ
jgi:hypothetical protein